MSRITPKQQQFIDEYLIDLNASQAAIRAGYSPKTARSQGQRLLTNGDIQKAIEVAQGEKAKKQGWDAERVLSRHVEIDEMSIDQIIDDEGSVLPLKNWPKVWLRSINSMEVLELVGKTEEEKITILKKIKWPDKLRNLELLGKHVDVHAYGEKRNKPDPIGGAEKIDSVRDIFELMGRIYRAMDSGLIASEEANKRLTSLNIMREAKVSDELERYLQEIEQEQSSDAVT